MARAMAVLANRGTLVVPHVVKAVGPATRRDETTKLALRPENLQAVRDGMHAVANSAVGTARKQDWHLVPGEVFGKTGTSQVGDSWKPWEEDHEDGGPWHHWFVGWVEGYGPRRIAFACLLHSRTEAAAGFTAAGAAREILTRWYEVHGDT
jgi:penicillin-binding protein 2